MIFALKFSEPLNLKIMEQKILSNNFSDGNTFSLGTKKVPPKLKTK